MDAAATLALLLQRVIDGAEARPDAATLGAILEEAARFAADRLGPFARVADRAGCRLEAGRVRAAPGHADAWRDFADAGWAGLAAGEAAGGQGLPLAVAAAVQEIMDAADAGFGMLAINARCAVRLLERHGDAATCAAWLPMLAAGRWGATISISEPQAGSDVGRIRTRAAQAADGTWRVTGEKCWISYGDHDLTERIGHFALARPAGAPAGTRGLSLFLVPDRLEDGRRNGATVLRLEEKLGLHSSPTCALAFEDAAAIPIGPMGRGLPTLFAMITAMRLGVAAQGAAVAQAAAEIAERYAAERGQGGDPAAAPIPITTHAEVRRLLLGLRARAEAARLIALQAAAWVDAGDAGDAAAAACAAMLLPVAKTCGAETAFANADAAIQVLGGAGYVKDGGVERLLRDCRVFSIYEGTTAIQGLDLLLRRVLGEGGAAVPFLRLLGLAAADGLLRRAGRQAGPLAARYAALAEFHRAGANARVALLAAQCRLGDVDATFDAVYGHAGGPA